MSNKNELKETLAAFAGLMGQLMEVLNKEETTPVKAPRVPKVAPVVVKKKPVAPSLVEDFEKWFITAPEDELYDVSRGQWECKLGDPVAKTAHVLLFHSMLTDKIKNASDVICIRPIGSKLTIFNGSRITYGRSWRAQRPPQQIAEDAGAAPIPFENVVSKTGGAGLDLAKLEILEWKGSEKLIIPPVARTRAWTGDFYVVERHFAGAMVLRVEDKYFLFDADREEVKEHGFNPFFTQLPGPAKTVAEAYALLMPDDVKKAYARGAKVIRQGEFFFVPADAPALKQGIVKSTGKYDSFFYDQLIKRLNLIGAAQINCSRLYKLVHVKAFLKRCAEHTAGDLPETVNHLNATKVVKDCIATLESSVGPEEAVSEEQKNENQTGRYNFRGDTPSQTHLGYVHDELNVRLGQATRGRWDNNRWTEVENTGALESKWQIRYQRNLDAANGQGVGGRGRHHVTAVYQPSATEAYAIGAVMHTGREHAPIYLENWHRIYANTATNSWTVSGDVD